MNAKPKPIVRAPERASRNLPPGHRVLHTVVPEKIFNAAKARALLEGIDWPKFVVQLLEQADPRKDGSLRQHVDTTPASS